VLHVGDGLGVVTHDLHFAVRPEIKEHLVIRLTIGWPWKMCGPNDRISCAYFGRKHLECVNLSDG